MEWLYGVTLLAETSALVEDLDAAAALSTLIAPWAAFYAADHPEGIRGSVSRYLGILETTTGRWDDAYAHYEQALAMNQSAGFRPWLALTQEDFARLLLARGEPGDAKRGERLLDEALSTYRELGMNGPLERARATVRA